MVDKVEEKTGFNTNREFIEKAKPILEGLLNAPITNDDVSDKVIDFDTWLQPILKKYNAGITAVRLKHKPDESFGFNKSGGF